MARKFTVESFGCQMSMHDAERIAGLLEREGYEPVADAAEAELVVINTCSVREHAEEKLYTRLGELRAADAETGTRPLVAVTGCVAQQEGQRLRRRATNIDVIAGTQAIKQLPGLLRDAAESPGRRQALVDINPYEDVSFPLGVTRRADPVKAYVTIIEGCNDFCSFCVVPYTRGHERMRPVSDILAEAAQALATGRREIHLLGQIVNHYRAPDDPTCDFPELLRRVARLSSLARLRFASPHPRHVSSRLIAAYQELPQVCRHLHLPVQSGSTRVLGSMRRRHTRDEYLQLVAAIRSALPGLALTTDIIVGFPGETEKDFEDTLSLVREVRYHGIFSFKYSPRPQTLARQRYPDDVPELEKTKRIVELQRVQREIQTGLHQAAVGQTMEVLVDGESRRGGGELAGRTSGNTVVNFPGPPHWIGRLAGVRVRRGGPHSLAGTPTWVEGDGDLPVNETPGQVS